MSSEEEYELKELLMQTLNMNGCLPKIRAQLRASVFMALDEDNEIRKREPLLNNKVKLSLVTEEGKLLFCLVKEFLDFFGLNCCNSVYEAETYLGVNYSYPGREKLIHKLGANNDECQEAPLLHLLLKQFLTHTFSKNERLEDDYLEIGHKTSTIQTDYSIDSPISNGVSERNYISNGDIEDLIEIKNKVNKSLDENLKLSPSASTISHGIASNNEKRSLNLNSTYSKDTFEDDDSFKGNVSSLLSDPLSSTSYLKLHDPLEASTSKHRIPGEASETQPVLKEAKQKFDLSLDKVKTQKSEKKTKNSLNSLADLPPLSVNKTRDILPSLYSRDFKEKPSHRELEKMFDMEADYHEDFMLSNDSDVLFKSKEEGTQKTSPFDKSFLHKERKPAKAVKSLSHNNKNILKTNNGDI